MVLETKTSLVLVFDWHCVGKEHRSPVTMSSLRPMAVFFPPTVFLFPLAADWLI